MLALLLVLQQSVADSSPFRALALPAPTPARSAAGAPGRGYWQQRADYTLEATLDTATNILRGKGRIYYVNRSSDVLDHVWVQLDQNLFAPGSITSVLNQPPLRFAGGVVFDFGGKGFVGGMTVDRFNAGGRPLATTVTGTMMRVELARPLAPDSAITFEVAWHFPVPPYGGGRMGRVGSRFYELGQWYPRMAVHIVVHGHARVSFTWSTATSTSPSRCPPGSSSPRRAACRIRWRCGRASSAPVWSAPVAPARRSPSLRRQRQSPTASGQRPGPRPGVSRRPMCAISPGPRGPICAGTRAAGTAS